MNALLWLVTLAYAVQAAIYWWHGQGPQAMIVTGYVIANLGLIWSVGEI